MTATQELHELGQSLWLDNITRDLLDAGTLARYIDELSVTGLTSNPTIFEHAIKDGTTYDTAIREKRRARRSVEEIFFELALEDLTRAADLFRPVYDRTHGVDGWVSLEVSPLVAHDTASTLAEAIRLHARADRPNLFIKIPGTKEGVPAIEEAIFAGVPVNVTLLFSREQYLAAAEAYLRGIERRIAAGREPGVGSVASLFISRWDAAVSSTVPEALRNRLGLAIAQRTYAAYRTLIASPRWQQAHAAGAQGQRLLWASTGTKDPNASDVLYIKSLAAPFTVNTMPEQTLLALENHGEIGAVLPPDGGDCEGLLTEFAEAGVDVDALAARLQEEGAAAFVKSWNGLLAVIERKGSAVASAAVRHQHPAPAVPSERVELDLAIAKPSPATNVARAPRDLPPALAPLVELALDLRWTWSHAGDSLWRSVDAETWEVTRNPWFMLQNVRDSRLDELARDAGFKDAMGRLTDERREHLRARSWCAKCVPTFEKLVAYFSMEFGLGEAIPLYAGGLGILAGDFLKAASDLGVPVVGVGILFQEGYFRQAIERDGQQHERYPYNDPATLPIQQVRATDGSWLRVPLDVDGRKLWVKVWLARAGRVSLYLLDTNDLLNSPADRGITAKLYGGGPETRLLQEVVLGVGGFRLLDLLGLDVSVVHMNEGHAAFAVIERARCFMRREQVSFDEALWAMRAGNAFTTHTPVAAGFDCFDPALVDRILLSPCGCFHDLGIEGRDFLALGQRSGVDDEPFNMAYLATRGSAFVNGVSRLHGEVSRTIFADIFPRWPEHEVPIDHVTNGVHVPSWDSAAADMLWTEACGVERWRGSVEKHELLVSALSDESLWSLRSEQRRALVAYARRRLTTQLAQRGERDAETFAHRALDSDFLTLGFARRFAEYKRPDLLLRDPERLRRLLTNDTRPVQIVVAGKAHPADENGKRMIAEWIDFATRSEVRDRVVFLEDYDIALAEQLTQGVDVWINTPRRLWEACGTSGMKVLANGGLNLSERDGWWAEVDSEDVGWGLGGGDGPPSDAGDAEELYMTLERDVVPEFYDRDDQGLPRRWLARIRASMSRLAPQFSANRMLREYLERIYVPAASAYARRTAEGARVAKDLSRWHEDLEAAWRGIRFGEVDTSLTDEGRSFRVAVSLGRVEPDAGRVELYADPVGETPAVRVPMKPRAGDDPADGTRVFECTIATSRPASDFTPRVVPFHPDAYLPLELPLVTWQR